MTNDKSHNNSNIDVRSLQNDLLTVQHKIATTSYWRVTDMVQLTLVKNSILHDIAIYNASQNRLDNTAL